MPTPPGHLTFENITRRFGSFTAVDDITLEIGKGECFSLLGPSGCGKTTLLRMAAGFETPDRGRILLDGKDITRLPPDKRPVNTVFQSYALFPHLSVRDNIAFGPRMAKRPRAEISSEVGRMLSLVDLSAHADKKPAQLSGGQKQRVAIARALVNKPEVLLLDEPLAALDLKLRQRLLVELDAIHDEVGVTFIYVTHDQGEAMSFSDRIAVMNKGHIEQIGTPQEIYEAPRSSFVASFIGDTNFIDATVTAGIDPQFCRCEADGFGTILASSGRQLAAGEKVRLSLRPEKLTVTPERTPQSDMHNIVAGIVEDEIYFGTHTRSWIRCGRLRLCAEMRQRDLPSGGAAPRKGGKVWISWRPEDGFLLEAEQLSSAE
jgi:spermidine/putrescine transport system ATP-binding protein